MLNKDQLKQEVLNVYEEYKDELDDNYGAPTSLNSRNGALKFIDILCEILGENSIVMPEVGTCREDISFDWIKEPSSPELHHSYLSISIDSDSMIYAWLSEDGEKFCGQTKLTDPFPTNVLNVLLERMKKEEKE